MRAVRHILLAIAAPGVFSSAAIAQFPGSGPSSRPLRLVVSGGVAMPTGGFKDAHDLGYHADVSLLLNIAGFPLRIRPEVSLTRFDLKDAITGGSAGAYGAGGYSQLLGGFGNVEIPLAGGLYVLAGVGMLNLRTEPGDGSAAPAPSSTEFAIDGGAGFRFRIGSIDGFIEGRVNNVFTDQGALNVRDVRVIPVTFGLVF
jgi:hypothetical protein